MAEDTVNLHIVVYEEYSHPQVGEGIVARCSCLWSVGPCSQTEAERTVAWHLDDPNL